MKIAMKTLLATLALASPSAFAEFNPESLLKVTKIAIADFTVAQPVHAEHFYGYKAWKSGDDARVKVYAIHDGATLEFNYTCHEHEPGELECHAQ